MKHGMHLPQIESHKLSPDFVVGQLTFFATKGQVWVDIDRLTQALEKARHFTTTDLQLMLKDMLAEDKIVKERKRAGHSLTSKVLDHYALK